MTLAYRWPNGLETDPIYDFNGDPYPAFGAWVPIDNTDAGQYYVNLTLRGTLLTFLEGGGTSGPIIPGSGPASGTAQFVLMAANGTTPNGRVLVAGTNVSIADSGPGGFVTINSTATGNVTAQYVTLALDGQLTNERVLTQGTGVVITDGGANGPVTVNVPATTAQFVVLTTNADLPNERVLTQGTNIQITDGGANNLVTIDALPDANKADKTTTITAGAGLTGGGSLAANRTIDVVAGNASIVVNANDLVVGFDATNPAALGSATPGTAVVPAHRDHVHPMPSASDVGAPPTARTLTAGAGLTGGGDLSANRTFDVVANADGSIVVNANDIQVGVISDAQHGSRAGGTLHAVVVAGGAAGFMSGTDKTKLDGLSAGVPTTRTLTAGNGLTGGGDLSADRTFDIVAANGSITVGANDIQVAFSATTPALATTGTGSAGSAVTPARSDHAHQLPTRTFTNLAQGLRGWASNPANGFVMDGGTGARWFPTQESVPTSSDAWYMELNLPIGALTITNVSLWLQGAAGHVGMPAVKPEIYLYQVANGGALSFLGQITDPSTTTAAYQASHPVSLTPLNTTANPNARYIVIVTGEYSTNSMGGLQIMSLDISGTYR